MSECKFFLAVKTLGPGLIQQWHASPLAGGQVSLFWSLRDVNVCVLLGGKGFWIL